MANRETVVAYLVAFLVKWKLFEAFIVPTGAMAPTIYGAHADVVCENCGKEYAVNMSTQTQAWQGRRPVHAVCPNCGEPAEIAADAPIIAGDRFLADKISRPRRWDVVAFEYPKDRQVSYVKRLVGLPGETVEIAGGEIFINGQRVQREPLQGQDMWLPVNDSKRPAKHVLSATPRWQPKSPYSRWKFADDQWTFDGKNAADDSLVFSGSLSDAIAYNERDANLAFSEIDPPLVGNIQLACDLKSFSGEGNLELRWAFDGQKASVKISAAGEAELTVIDSPAPTASKTRAKAVRGKLATRPSAAGRLVFAVRDGRAYLMQGNRVVVTAPVGPQDLAGVKQRSKPAVEPCRLEIAGSRCDAAITRVVLWKDICYCNLTRMRGAESFPAYGCTDHPIHLGKREYFVLGDNSTFSSDSRFWGAVSESDLIGVGRLIYWPLGRLHVFE